MPTTKKKASKGTGPDKGFRASVPLCQRCQQRVEEVARWATFGGDGLCERCAEIRADEAADTVTSTVMPSGIARHDPDARPITHVARPVVEWDIEIDPEFQAAQRPLTSAEWFALEADVVAHGCLDPLIVWDDEGLEVLGRGYPQRVRPPRRLLIDGHHRYQICRDNPGLRVPITVMRFANRAAVLSWMRDHQLGRRNLSPAERDALLAQDYEQLAQPRGGKREKSKAHSEPLKRAKSAAKQVAEKHGVSEATVKRAVQGQRAKRAIAAKAPELSAEAVQALPRRAAQRIANLDQATLKAAADAQADAQALVNFGKRRQVESSGGASREKADSMLAAHLALFPVSARYEQSSHLLDAINAWRGQHFVGPTRNGKPRPR